MRRSTVSIAGREYPLCFSLRVVKACWDKYGSLDGMFSAIRLRTAAGHDNAESPADACLWLLSSLLDAGQRYDRVNGAAGEAPELPDQDAIMDVMDMADIQHAVMSAILSDGARTVEAEPGKNGGSGEELPSS